MPAYPFAAARVGVLASSGAGLAAGRAEGRATPRLQPKTYRCFESLWVHPLPVVVP
jgi:hypothetical protein